MNYLTLFLTEQCNRKCEYCDISKIENKKKPNKPTVRKFIPLIKKSSWSNIVLTGGEVSLIDPLLLDFIMTELKDKILKINTNGLWFKFGHFKKYYEITDYIQYHPISEINEHFEPIIDKKITYYFPIHKKNIDYLDDFLNRNRNLVIRLAPYDMKYLNNKYLLSVGDFTEISRIIGKYGNITTDTKKMFDFLSRNNDLTLLKKMCFYPSIDFVNCRINKCIKSHSLSTWISLTEENFNNMEQLKYTKDSMCDYCHMFVRDFETIIRKLVCSD
jgi:organic radical activating enzyme